MFKLLTTLQVEPRNKLSQQIVGHLKLLRMELMHYFPDIVCCIYAVNPFGIDPALPSVGMGEEKEIIDIEVDETEDAMEKKCSPIDFWLSTRSTYPT